MNERDFDNIFRRKIEQIPTPLPDENLWQNLNTSLGSMPTPKTTQWSKIALAALLLSLLMSNIYFWKKLDNLTKNATANSTVKFDTINKQTIVYQYDTIVKNIYIKEKTTVYKTSKSPQENTLSSEKNNFTKTISANNKLSNTSEKTPTRTANNDKNIVEKEGEKIAENTKKIIQPNHTEENNTAKAKDEMTSKDIAPTEKSIENIDTLSQNKETQTILKDSLSEIRSTNNPITTKENKPKTEDFTPTPSTIEPVKKSIFSRIELGLQGKGGFLLGEGQDENGGCSSFGLSIATQFASHYRLFADVDFTKVSLIRGDTLSDFGITKPTIPNKEEHFHHWEIRQQPVVQYHIGVSRIFSWKKLEPSIGIALGAMSVLPFEVRYQTEHDKNKEKKDYFAGINSNSQTFLSDIKTQLGVRYQLKKGFSIALNADYQYFINQKSNWQHQLGVGAGLHYTF